MPNINVSSRGTGLGDVIGEHGNNIDANKTEISDTKMSDLEYKDIEHNLKRQRTMER